MRKRTKQGLQVFRRVHEFLKATDVPAVLGSVAKHVETLGQIADRISGHAVEQETSRRNFSAAATQGQSQAQTLRREMMRPIARTADSLFPNDPVVREALALPRGTDHEATIAGALSMADRAAEHKDKFIAAGFDDDFIERLRKGAADLRAAIDEKGNRFGRRSAATAGLLAEVTRGREVVRLLDDMVAPRLVGSADLSAQWRTLTRFARDPKAADATEPGTTPPVVAPPVSAPPVIAPTVPAPPVIPPPAATPPSAAIVPTEPAQPIATPAPSPADAASQPFTPAKVAA